MGASMKIQQSCIFIFPDLCARSGAQMGAYMSTTMKHMMYMETDFGKLGIAEDGTGITDIYFADSHEDGEVSNTQLLLETVKQLSEYFAGNRTEFNIPISMKGTEFQKDVWKALSSIPYGETRSYKQIAEQIGKPKACRAVGMANHVNKIAILIPCHRVVGTNGSLTGYAGGLGIKDYLLALERR